MDILCFSFTWKKNRIRAAFHSVKHFALADFLELKISHGKISSISIFHTIKKKKDSKIELYQQYYKSDYINWYLNC